MELPEISTTRLELRSLTFDDTKDIYKIFSDPKVTRYWGYNALAGEIARI